MKHIKWKSLIIPSAVCLLPVLIGILLWDKLPERMAIHFNLNNEPDNFANKGFVVFGIPFLMLVIQIVCSIINDVNVYKYGTKKFENVPKWIIPVMTVALQILLFAYSLNMAIDIRRCSGIIVGIMLIVIGSYIPKLDYVKKYKIDAEKARKINRFVGYGTIVMGALFTISAFLPTVFTLVCIWMMVPYGITAGIYTEVVVRK